MLQAKNEQGWICPRCGQANAPWKGSCTCSPQPKKNEGGWPWNPPPVKPYDPWPYRPWPKKYPYWLDATDQSPQITWSTVNMDNFF